MKCPKCEHPVSPGQTVCEHCGAKIVREDMDLVFSNRDMPKRRKNPINKIAVILLCVLLAAGAGFLAFRYLNRNNNSGKPSVKPLSTAPVTDPVTQPATQDASKAKEEPSNAAATKSGDKTDEQKLEEYIKTSDLRENLLSLAGDNMSLSSLQAERNVIIAHYQVHLRADDSEQAEYFEALPDAMSEICNRLDEDLYSIRSKTGVEEAQLQIQCTDSAGSTIFSELV